LNKGILISFEGLDKVGKSTQVERLIKHLTDKNIQTVLVREPGSTEAGERIRNILADPALKGKISPLCEFLLYSASRSQLTVEKIAPHLQNEELVIADRFYDSSTAYQGYGRGIPLEFINQVNTTATNGIRPDLTILLVAEKFASGSKKVPDRFAPNLFDDRLEQEFMDFRRKVQEGFLDVAKQEPDRFLVINANEKREQIAKKIAIAVDNLLKARLKKQ
jgi:dTMP kinase